MYYMLSLSRTYHCGKLSSHRICLRLHVLQPFRDLVWLLRGGPPPGPAMLNKVDEEKLRISYPKPKYKCKATDNGNHASDGSVASLPEQLKNKEPRNATNVRRPNRGHQDNMSRDEEERATQSRTLVGKEHTWKYEDIRGQEDNKRKRGCTRDFPLAREQEGSWPLREPLQRLG